MIQLDPTSGQAYWNRGYSYFRLGDKEKAAADAAKAKELGYDPDTE